jgi:hypothetical protein
MQKKRRSGRASTKTPVEDEIAHLRGLDLGGLRARWQSYWGIADSGKPSTKQIYGFAVYNGICRTLCELFRCVSYFIFRQHGLGENICRVVWLRSTRRLS